MPDFFNQSRFCDAQYLEFGEEEAIILTRIEAKRFVRKSCKHFKMSTIPTLKFHAKKNLLQSGLADSEANEILVGTKPSVLTLSHELSHIFTKSGHTKRAWIMLYNIITYARKNQYWKRS